MEQSRQVQPTDSFLRGRSHEVWVPSQNAKRSRQCGMVVVRRQWHCSVHLGGEPEWVCLLPSPSCGGFFLPWQERERNYSVCVCVPSSFTRWCR